MRLYRLHGPRDLQLEFLHQALASARNSGLC